MSLPFRFLCLSAVLVLMATASFAGPISSCEPNANQLFTCNLYETNSDGNFTENPSKVLVGNTIFLGNVILLEPGVDLSVEANRIDPANWSDVVSFTQTSDQFFVQLFSDPFSAEFVRVTLASNPEYLNESVDDPTTFIGGSGNTYNIFSQSAVDTDVPEPGSATLLTAGAALLAGLMYRRKFTA